MSKNTTTFNTLQLTDFDLEIWFRLAIS